MTISNILAVGASPRELRQVRFMRGGPDRSVSTGIHLARRRGWPDSRPLEAVFVEVIEEGDTCFTQVWRFGQAHPEAWRDWEFGAYAVGLESITAAACAMPLIEDAVTMLH